MIDVIIVGAGPVGLMLAGQLQRRGVSYRLFEARTSREYWCKALGVSPRTLEIFDQLGILDEALNRGLQFTAVNTTVNGELVARVERRSAEDPYHALALGQYDTEEILEAYLRSHGGRIEWGSEVTAVSGTSVTVNGEVIEGRFLVGCDGAHSLVRKSIGVSFEGAKYGMTFMLGDVELDWDRPHSEVWKMVVTTPEGEMRNMVAAVPIPGASSRYRVSMAGEMGEGAPTLEMLQEASYGALPPLRNLRWSSFYNISHRLASRYSVGNVFLAGDAAHIHPPIGGLGMNTGLQDAYNLAWKLAYGGARLLDTYHEERHRVGEEVVGLTAGRMDDAVEGKVRDEAAEERKNTQFDVNYCGQTLARNGTGQRVDFVEGLTREGVRRSARLIDLMRDGGFHLFCWGGRFTGSVPATVWEFGKDVFGEHPWGEAPGALLVRPDGYVCWRGGLEGDAELTDLLATIRQ